MARDPKGVRLWYPHYVRDFRAKTSHLSLAEKGAYRALMDEYWERQGPLPNDDELLRRIIGATPKEFRKIRGNVLPYFEVLGDTLVHKRIEEEISRAKTNMDSKSLRLAEARKKRWPKAGAENDQTTEQITDLKSEQITSLPSPSPIPKNQEPRKNIRAPSAQKSDAEKIDEALKSALGPETAKAVIEHRRKLRKPLTVRAAELLASKFLAAPCGPETAANAMIANGWQGFEPEWLGRRHGHNGALALPAAGSGKTHADEVERAIADGFVALQQRKAASNQT